MSGIVYYYANGALWTESGRQICAMTLSRAGEIALEDGAELREGDPWNFTVLLNT